MPARIGEHILLDKLGRGGMADVYLAVRPGPAKVNKLLVLKTLRTDVMERDEEVVAMFMDEARLAARLNHKNVVQTYEVDQADGVPFLTMQYLDGCSLRMMQRKLRPDPEAFPPEYELYVLAQTALGLQYAHDLCDYDGTPLGVVHRDVSPQNVFVTYRGQVKLLDFGIAKAACGQHMTANGRVKGKLEYMAPEQLRGERLDGRADIFALGAMLYEAVSRRRFVKSPRQPDLDKMHDRLRGGEVPLTEVCPDAPPALVQIVSRAIALNPDERYARADQFAHDLESYLATLAAPPTAPKLAELLQTSFAEEHAATRRLLREKMSTLELPPGGRVATPSGSITLQRDEARSRDIRTKSKQEPNSSRARSRSRAHRPSRITRLVGTHARLWAIACVLIAAAVITAAQVRRIRFEERLQQQALAREQAEVAARQAAADAAHKRHMAMLEKQRAAYMASTLALRIRTVPTQATVSLDGQPYDHDDNRRLPKDYAVHRIEVQAPGYRSERIALSFDRDHDLLLKLREDRSSGKAE